VARGGEGLRQSLAHTDGLAALTRENERAHVSPLNCAAPERKMRGVFAGIFTMDMPGAAYFYTLAQIAIAFSGFAALLMALRQIRGIAMSKFHLWVARSYIQSGLITAMNAMFSPLLFACGLSQEDVWRVVSAFIAAQSIALIVVVPGQWRSVTPMPMPLRLKVHIASGVLLNIALIANIIGYPFPPNGGFVMLAISWNLFAFFLQFAESVNFFFEAESPEQEPSVGPAPIP
jgi:hypothetical protein